MSHDFARLGVPATLAAVLEDRGITSPTPIQTSTLPDSLAGRDVLGRGRTGSGKTYAFLLPMVARLSEGASARPRRPRALILAPTRELASQIEEALKPLARTAGLSVLTVFGGVNQNPQARALGAGVDVLIACPGRLLDLAGQRLVDLSAIAITVVDEADHMADMGFLPMVRRILDQTPRKGQRMLFSATLDEGVGVLVRSYLTNPVTHEADSAESPVAAMDHHVVRIPAGDRTAVIADLAAAPGKVIVFTRTKHGARKLAKQLIAQGVPAVDLHGNLAQNARTRNLDAFHSGSVETLVATDIAARGIHVDDVALVVHADPPTEHKAYLHRSGRTARAGKAGTVLTLVTSDQASEVRSMMRAAKIRPTEVDGRAGHPVFAELAPGPRRFVTPEQAAAVTGGNRAAAAEGQSGGGRRRGSQGQRSAGQPASGARQGQPRSGQARAAAPRPQGRPSSGRPSQARAGQTSAAPSGAARMSQAMGRRPSR